MRIKNVDIMNFVNIYIINIMRSRDKKGEEEYNQSIPPSVNPFPESKGTPSHHLRTI